MGYPSPWLGFDREKFTCSRWWSRLSVEYEIVAGMSKSENEGGCVCGEVVSSVPAAGGIALMTKVVLKDSTC